MQADDLRLREQLGQGQVAGAQSFDLRVGVGVIGQQLAAEAGHDPRERRADLPGADHPDGLAHQIEPGQPMQAEIAVPGTVVGAVQAAIEGHDQCHGMFGHGMGRVGRHPDDAQAQALGGEQVDVVVAGRAQGYQPRASFGQPLQHRGAEVIVDEGAHHFMPFGQGHGVEVQTGGLELQLKTCGRQGLGETVAVVGLAAEKNHAHGGLLAEKKPVGAVGTWISSDSGSLDLALDQALIRASLARRLMARSNSSRAAVALGSCCLSRVSLRWQAARNCGTPQ